MNMLGTSYTLQHKSLDIYVAGCGGNPHCVGCHNPESWDFNQGTKYDYDYFVGIKTKAEMFSTLIENIMIFGGEPLDQNHDELIKMLVDLKTLNKQLWLFTRYEIEEVPNHIKLLCNYVKTGRFVQELKTDTNFQDGIHLASLNQKIHKLN